MKKEKGISLLEVLVALVVLSVGLLGVASLQGLSKRANHEALQRTLATYLADEIIERMRGNSTVFKVSGAYVAGPYHTGVGASALGGTSIATEPAACDNSNTCTPAELATRDRWEWEQSIDGAAIKTGGTNAGGLVNPKACIIHNADGKIRVILAWQSLTVTTDADSAGLGCSTGSDNTRRQLVVDTFI